MSDEPKDSKGGLSIPSGNHPAVQAFRAKADSIAETTMPLLVALDERIQRARSAPPKPLAGDWSIVVAGIGPIPADANRLAAKLVQELRLGGYVVTHATVTSGADVTTDVELALIPPSSNPDKDT